MSRCAPFGNAVPLRSRVASRFAVSRLACLLLLVAAPAHADRFTFALASENWNDENSPMHGVALLAWDTKPLWRQGRLHVVLNTDTLSLGFDGLRVNEAIELGWELKTEFKIAGVLADYFQDGQTVQGRGFYANYFQPRLFAKARIAPRTWLEAEVGGRRWLFETIEDGPRATDPNLELPANAWVFEPRLRYTWWNLSDDAGWHDRHRFFPRLRGLAAGLELGLDARSEARRWGAFDETSFSTPDPRNDPDPFAPRVRQWFMAGWQATPTVRVEVREQAAFGVGEDDLSRDRLGGSSPYTANLPGAPWGAWFSERYVSGLASGHVKVMDDLEIGPQVGAIVLADPARVGDETATSTEIGVGLVGDWRHGPWQVNLRGGWSPTVSETADIFAFNAWLSAGYIIELDEGDGG